MNRSALITTIIPALGIAYLLYAYAALPWTDLRILGLILAVAGLAGVAVARAQLGISFTLAPEARALVTTASIPRFAIPSTFSPLLPLPDCCSSSSAWEILRIGRAPNASQTLFASNCCLLSDLVFSNSPM